MDSQGHVIAKYITLKTLQSPAPKRLGPAVGLYANAHLVDSRHLLQNDIIQSGVEVIKSCHDHLWGEFVSPRAEADQVREEDRHTIMII